MEIHIRTHLSKRLHNHVKSCLLEEKV
uniref:Uncharacterized protein n=1 Tax=Rhizophora mucronata TaxID=61149 RepID=A0A2P2J1F5_RHIMU